MSKKRRSFISLPTIIFLIIAYNFIFGDDDEKKKVGVKTSNEPVVSQDLKEELNDVKTELKEALKEAKEVFVKVKGELISDSNEEESQEVIEEEKPKEEVIISKDKIEPPTNELKPLDDAKENEPIFKKL